MSEIRAEFGAKRDEKGRFISGNKEAAGLKNSGRPPVIRHIRELAREQTETAFAALLDIAQNGESESARVAAIKELLDRGWGKSAQPLVGKDEGPILISWLDASDTLDDSSSDD